MKITSPIKPTCDSMIGWLGGKTRLRPTILNSIPPHKCYVEVFAGSATVFFGKAPGVSRTEIINDVHGELVNLMKVISGTCFDEDVRQEFLQYLRYMPAAREVFEDWKHWKKDRLDELTFAQRAFRFFYCVKKGFSCTPKGGYEASPFSLNRYNMSTDFEQIAERFRAKNAQIEMLDFRRLVEKYNNQRADVFFFMDPPYFVANDTNYYEFGFTTEDHEAHKACCDDINKNGNTFLVTYDDVPEVISMYDGYHIYRTDPILYKAMQTEVERTIEKRELFITNYDIAEMIHKKKSKKTKREAFDLFEDGEIDGDRIEFGVFLGLTRI